MAQIDKPNLYFDTKLYSGNGSTQSITGVGFQPDLVWVKRRDSANENRITDAVRGVTKEIYADLTTPEATNSIGLTSFNSNGFSVGSNSGYNSGSGTYVAWNWKANGAGSANTDGTINSTVSANTTAGFSIIKYTGTGSNATVGHGLGAVPGMILFKCTNDAQNWRVYHRGMDTSAPEDYALILNNNSVRDNDNTAFNDTAPTTITFGLGTTATINQNGNIHIAYAFAEKKGFSKFGSYTGNGNADGTFIYTGFKPAFVILKCSSAVSKWLILDNKRPTSGSNPNNARLFADVTNAESTSSNMADFYSNGFKLRTTDTDHNANGATNIYMAFAENPIVGSNDVPATAE